MVKDDMARPTELPKVADNGGVLSIDVCYQGI